MAATGGLVRDPNFWKRFSLAVHLTEENQREPQSATSSEMGSFG
jgi:hypothetical protein